MSDWVIRLIEQAGILGVGFLMFLETIFPPIPTEMIMPIAGATRKSSASCSCPERETGSGMPRRD